MSNEKLLLNWSEFQNNSEFWLKGVQRDKEFCDVTLVCEDYEIQAHRLIISRGSKVFQDILQKTKHAHPIIYLQGISQYELKYVLEFLYTGEVSVDKSRLKMFIESAKELKIVGILDLVESETPLGNKFDMNDITAEGAVEDKGMTSVDSFNDVKLEDPLKSGAAKISDWMPQYAKKENNLGAVKYRCMAGKKCVKTFNKLDTLKNHVRFKHIARSFSCDQCKHSSFTRKQMLAHKKIAHRKPDQECHVCHEAFKTTLLLASHYLKTHKEQQCKKCVFKATGKKFYNHKKNCYRLKKADHEEPQNFKLI